LRADAPEEARAGADVLEAWDNTTAAASRGGVLFQRFWDGYAAAVRPPRMVHRGGHRREPGAGIPAVREPGLPPWGGRAI
jgi:hypothetical protein